MAVERICAMRIFPSLVSSAIASRGGMSYCRYGNLICLLSCSRQLHLNDKIKETELTINTDRGPKRDLNVELKFETGLYTASYNWSSQARAIPTAV